MAGGVAACGYALALVLVHLAWFRHGHGRFRGLSLVLQAALGLVPVLHLGVTWSALSCFFLGSVLLVAKPLVSVPLLVLVPGGVGVLSPAWEPRTCPWPRACTRWRSRPRPRWRCSASPGSPCWPPNGRSAAVS